jgi:site-specific recombinase XerD
MRGGDGPRLVGQSKLVGLANKYLAHLGVQSFSPATVRGYAYDLANFGAFLAERALDVPAVSPTDPFDYLDWQRNAPPPRPGAVVALTSRRPAAETV